MKYFHVAVVCADPDQKKTLTEDEGKNECMLLKRARVGRDIIHHSK